MKDIPSLLLSSSIAGIYVRHLNGIVRMGKRRITIDNGQLRSWIFRRSEE